MRTTPETRNAPGRFDLDAHGVPLPESGGVDPEVEAARAGTASGQDSHPAAPAPASAEKYSIGVRDCPQGVAHGTSRDTAGCIGHGSVGAPSQFPASSALAELAVHVGAMEADRAALQRAVARRERRIEELQSRAERAEWRAAELERQLAEARSLAARIERAQRLERVAPARHRAGCGRVEVAS